VLRLQRTSAPATIANDKNYKSEETDLKPHKNALKAGSSGWTYMMSGRGLSGLSIRRFQPHVCLLDKAENQRPHGRAQRQLLEECQKRPNEDRRCICSHACESITVEACIAAHYYYYYVSSVVNICAPLVIGHVAIIVMTGSVGHGDDQHMPHHKQCANLNHTWKDNNNSIV
jgi:hypothetical protein